MLESCTKFHDLCRVMSAPDCGQIQRSTRVQFSEENRPLNNQDDSLAFNTSASHVTPSINRVKYKNPSERESSCVAPPSTLSRPNYEDILRRVAVVIHQHITKCEARLSKATPETFETGLFHSSKMEKFSEEVSE